MSYGMSYVDDKRRMFFLFHPLLSTYPLTQIGQQPDELTFHCAALLPWRAPDSQWSKQGRRHEFSTGGGGQIPTGGTDSGETKPPTPKFRFLLGFRPLYLGNIGKSENFDKYA